MKVEARDEKGELQTWVIEGAAPAQLAESGLTTTTLRPGDHVIVSGQPGRIAEDHRLLLETIERPSDGFKWQGPAGQ
jgi:hydrogenase maturation factor